MKARGEGVKREWRMPFPVAGVGFLFVAAVCLVVKAAVEFVKLHMPEQ